MPISTKLLGRWGESVAAEYLRKQGWKILGMNYRSRWGEVDLIAGKGGMVAFVEVKLRKSDRFAPAREYVDRAKQRRLRATAEVWLDQSNLTCPARFDIIEVYAPEGSDTARPEIHHIEDAFT